MSALQSLSSTPAVEPLPAPSEAEAARRLYERHAPRVLSYCRRRLRSVEEAEDALQTTFMYALRGLRRGVVPDSEVAWLLKIAHNVCLTRWHSARRCAVEVARDPHVLQDMFAATSIDRDELIPLPEALERLSPNQRRAILLREWQGLSYREIAAELKLSESAVETLIFRARRALAQELSGESEVRPGRTTRALDLGSALATLKSCLGGSAALKVTTAVAVMGATLGAGAALEQRLDDGPVTIAPTQVAVEAPARHERSVDRGTPPRAVVADAFLPDEIRREQATAGPRRRTSPSAPAAVRATLPAASEADASPTAPTHGATSTSPAPPATSSGSSSDESAEERSKKAPRPPAEPRSDVGPGHGPIGKVKEIAEPVGKVKERILGPVVEPAGKKLESVSETVDEATAHAQETVAEATARAQETVENATERAREAVDEARPTLPDVPVPDLPPLPPIVPGIGPP